MMDLSPFAVREIIDAKLDEHTGILRPTVYKLFGFECPQPVMAAYERLWTTRGRGGRSQADGEELMAWVVTTTLLAGNFEKAIEFRDALESLGWRPPE